MDAMGKANLVCYKKFQGRGEEYYLQMKNEDHGALFDFMEECPDSLIPVYGYKFPKHHTN